MRKLFFIALVAVFASGCCPCRKAGSSVVVENEVIQRDSIYVKHVDTLRVVERDTVWMQRIEQSHDRVMTQTAFSFLENTYATSTARIDTCGVLTHTLDTKDSVALPVRLVEVERIVHDTIYRAIEDKKKLSSVETSVIERRVRHTTWWQKTQIIALWALLAILAIKYRKQLMSLIKKVILWI